MDVVAFAVRTDDDGTLWAEAVGLPGCLASGTTEAELLECAREAAAQYLRRPVEVTLVRAETE